MSPLQSSAGLHLTAFSVTLCALETVLRDTPFPSGSLLLIGSSSPSPVSSVFREEERELGVSGEVSSSTVDCGGTGEPAKNCGELCPVKADSKSEHTISNTMKIHIVRELSARPMLTHRHGAGSVANLKSRFILHFLVGLPRPRCGPGLQDVPGRVTRV